MKKILLIATSWMILSSCAKDVATPEQEAANEQMRTAALEKEETGGIKAVRAYGAIVKLDPEGPGSRGWYLQVNQYEWEVPINLDPEFKREGLVVDVAYYRTDRLVECKECTDPKYMVQIQNIMIAGSGGN